MNDGDIIATSITVLAVLASTLAFNWQIGKVGNVFRIEMDACFAKLDANLEIRFNAMESRFDSIDRKLDEFLRIYG